ncbi:protein Wnt-10a [Cimex lectularius]|uniref:Protein Wnt n=1 Tax=Cimex lectularius TaxID=79782 RepID=A0A8I6RU77_CIMLE|nr:protein Wnt-10a [Cimex lectularius]
MYLLVLLMTTNFFTTSTGLVVRGSTVCRTFAGLERKQIDVCRRHPELTMAAVQGLATAVKECQFQFRWHRWNCSSLMTKNKNPHTSFILKRGYRESGFAHAITSAGVAHSVARSCAQGKILECGCEPLSRHRSTSKSWKWGGCSHNLQFGIDFSTKFLDVRESNNGDIQSRVNLHNNEAGRLAVARNMEIRCKCHGVSGSCELKTCWRAAPDFRRVGAALKDRFREAVMVEESNQGGSEFTFLERRRGRRRRKKKKRKKKKSRANDLAESILFYEKSPSFCELDTRLEVPGTTGRICNRNGRGVDGCGSLCCGRGYNIIRRRKTDRCNCKFHWCCYVTCRNCTSDEWITVCK